MEHKEKLYSGNTAYIVKSKEYTAEDGERGREVELYKRIYGGEQFWRIWLSDLLTALGLINNSKQLDVVFYIFEHARPSDNLYLGTLRYTSEKAGVSLKTTATIFKKMQDADIIRKVQMGAYMVKPSLLVKGSDTKKARLTIQYERLTEETTDPKIEKSDDDGQMLMDERTDQQKMEQTYAASTD